MHMNHRILASTALLAAALTFGCGKKEADTSTADTDVEAIEPTDTAPPPGAGTPAPAESSSRPLTVADIDRWRKGMEGELQAVQEAGAKLKAAKTSSDTSTAVMGVQETATMAPGARAAGVDEERYKFIRNTFSDAVKYLTPLELEGFDTTKMGPDMVAEVRKGNEQNLARIGQAVPPDVLEALKPRAVELRKQSLQLVGARLKSAGM